MKSIHLSGAFAGTALHIKRICQTNGTHCSHTRDRAATFRHLATEPTSLLLAGPLEPTGDISDELIDFSYEVSKWSPFQRIGIAVGFRLIRLDFVDDVNDEIYLQATGAAHLSQLPSMLRVAA